MNHKLILLLIAIAVASLISCKKDKDNATPNPNPSNPPLSSPLLVAGNYWVYETVFYNQQGNMTATTDYDSVFIEKDTMINGTKWYKQRTVGTSLGTEHNYTFFLRDSSGILVNNYGVQLSEKYKNSGLVDSAVYTYNNDTIYETKTILSPHDTTVTVPAGTFVAKNIKIAYKIHFGGYRYRDAIDLQHKQWGVSLVSTFFYIATNDASYYEKRLARYRVN